ncbi:MAG TPA: hypothetical protein VE967_09410 [Gemmatimonadaceae bacterium]|nr:hypothetical protein [Gemmatimonadaceae bacterium]
MTEKKSDFGTAVTGFFVGAIVLALILSFISNRTTARYKEHEAATAEHKAP